MQSVVFRGKEFPLSGNPLGGIAKGYTYTCATCGEQWGRLETRGNGYWINSTWPCENHGNEFNRGGSFLHRVSWLDFSSQRSLANSLATCSDDLLRHEALMVINQRIGNGQV